MQNARTLLNSLPSDRLPAEIIELENMMQLEHPNLVEVAKVISKNADLLGDFLSIANNVLKRDEQNQLHTARAAVNVMGLGEIRKLFLISYLEKQLPQTPADQSLMIQSKRSAIAATEISYRLNEISRSEAYLACFLQNIGGIYMARKYGEEYVQKVLNNQISRPFGAYQEELTKYHTAHTFVGSLVAKQWGMDDLLCKSILLHHTKDVASLASYNLRVSQIVALTQLTSGLVADVFAKNYVTQELKDAMQNAKEYLDLPDKSIKSAIAALQKWGLSGNDHFGSL